MSVLAFDTATAATAVALSPGREQPALQARDDPPPGQRPGHAGRLLPLVDELMARAELGWDDLALIAVGTGPGTFTGLRIGIATARALARAAGLPLAGVSTLLSLAHGAATAAQAAGAGHVVAVLDARRGEAFAAAWRLGGWEPVLETGAYGPDELAARVGRLGPAPLAVGDGAIRFRELLERRGAIIPDDGSAVHRVTATVHAELARGLHTADPDEIRPEYIRIPDAELTRRAAQSR